MNRSRFLDDIWSCWNDTAEAFLRFLEMVNLVGSEIGITFTGECGKSVQFLDVTTTLNNGSISTTMFVKPTDSERYLNRRSYHSKHTFTGIPFSQFRRAAVICSDYTDREVCISRMEEKFVNSGYRREDLAKAKTKALTLDRASLLRPSAGGVAPDSPKVLACVINQDPQLRKELGAFFKSHDKEVKDLLGNVRIVISERRHSNIASMLFQKGGFSQNQIPVKETQHCKSSRCLTARTMNIDKKIQINGIDIKIDYRYDCATKTVIYLAICRLCEDILNLSNFYFGQTVNSLMGRNNGHRDKFSLNKYDKSALSMHIYEKHIDNFGDKLKNYDFGVVKHVSAVKLDRTEDFYIYITQADTKGLNRYKVSK